MLLRQVFIFSRLALNCHLPTINFNSSSFCLLPPTSYLHLLNVGTGHSTMASSVVLTATLHTLIGNRTIQLLRPQNSITQFSLLMTCWYPCLFIRVIFQESFVQSNVLLSNTLLCSSPSHPLLICHPLLK